MVADDNSRITLAVLKRDLEHLTATVEILRGDIASFGNGIRRSDCAV
jgi:hypothetical protein